MPRLWIMVSSDYVQTLSIRSKRVRYLSLSVLCCALCVCVCARACVRACVKGVSRILTLGTRNRIWFTRWSAKQKRTEKGVILRSSVAEFNCRM